MIRPPERGDSARVQKVPIEEIDLSLRSLRLPGGKEPRGSFAAWLSRHGRHDPVLATEGMEEGKLVLFDGFKRIDWLRTQGETRVLTTVLSLSRPDALSAMAQANAGRRGLSALEEAWIVASLHEDDGLEQVEIARRLGRHKSWVCRRLSLSKRLEAKVQEDVRIGLIPPSTAREIVRLPRGNQAKAAEAVCRHGLSARETHGLVRLLLSARPDERRGILDDPRRELPPTKPPSAPPPDPALGQTANRIRGQILSIHSRANRLEALLLGVSAPSLSREEAELIAKLAALVLEKVKTVLLTAKKLGEREASHAG